MAGAKQPINLIIKKNRKHLTKKQIDERRKTEVTVPSDNISPPSYLTKTQKAEFDKIAAQLIEINILTNLDCDALARFIISQSKYLKYNKLVNAILSMKIDEINENVTLLEKYNNMLDKSFRQCRQAASDLGLTISSRCKLTLPTPKEDDTPKTEAEKLFSGVI